MIKPTMTQAEWISARLEDSDHSTDDVFDVLTGQITRPTDFVAEVEALSRDYEYLLRRGNARSERN